MSPPAATKWPVDVTCLGIIVADVFARPVRALPNPGGLHLVEDIALRGGGCALNTATTLARLGLSVALAGKLGTDAFGDYLAHLADARGLGCAFLVRDERSMTSASIVLVDEGGERSFLHLPGANGSLTSGDINRQAIFRGRALHIGGALVMPEFDGEPTAELLAEAREHGLFTSVDTVWDDSANWHRINRSLDGLDLFAPSIAEARAITGAYDVPAVASELRKRGVREVVLKLGAGGSYADSDDFEGYIEPFVVDVVDETGAGDAFMAGLLYGRLAGWSLVEAARFGNAAGALATTEVGATEALLTIDSVLELEKWSEMHEATPESPGC